MAFEQSINGDTKLKGGIVGISQRPAELQRWFLTGHKRAAVTTSLKRMCAVEKHDRLRVSHKESSTNRVTRDEGDVQKLFICFTSGMMTAPFCNDGGNELLNFATGVVLPTDIAEQIVTFVEKRLNTSEVSFWDTVSNLKIKTSSSTKTNVKPGNDRFLTVSADRDLFGRLLIAANSRQINRKELLSDEL